jgi:L-glutamine-phosphate cytidylyltransferase
MGTLTESLPKGMLVVAGKTLIERQIEVLRRIGITEIVIVTGYKAEKIQYRGIRYYHNDRYADTNMVETLMCAREEMTEDILVAYSDIIYSPELASMVAAGSHQIGVAVDEAWRDYWQLRYGTTETDLESLTVAENGLITDIGRPVESSEGLAYRYIGLLKFSLQGIRNLVNIYNDKKNEGACWRQSGKPFEKGYMTDLLNEAIDSGLPVHPVVTRRGWFELDTAADYEVCNLHYNGTGIVSELEKSEA